MPDARRVAPISVSVYCLRLEVAFSACVFAVRFRQLRIPPNYLVLMPILNTPPHNARLPWHVVSAVSHRLLWVTSITKNTSNAATHTINAHFVQSTPICLWQSVKSCIFAASKYIMTSKVSKIEALSSYREIAMWKFLFFSWGTVWCLFICFIYASP